MSFDRTIFNQGVFNQDGQNEVYLSVEGFEQVNCVSRVVENVYLEVNGYESIPGDAILSYGYVLSVEGRETVGAAVELRMVLNLEGEAQGQISGDAKAGTIVGYDVSGAERISAATKAAYILAAGADGFTAFNLNAQIGANINPEAEGYELISATVSVDHLEEITLFADVSIPPGGKLIIDARYFTAYLNGVNVIDKIRGEWIDELSRDAIELRVNAGNSNQLQTSLLYEELYL